jgi:hypothetical protein
MAGILECIDVYDLVAKGIWEDQIDSQTHTHRHTDTHTHSHMCTRTDRQTDRHTRTPTHTHTPHTHTHTHHTHTHTPHTPHNTHTHRRTENNGHYKVIVRRVEVFAMLKNTKNRQRQSGEMCQKVLGLIPIQLASS